MAIDRSGWKNVPFRLPAEKAIELTRKLQDKDFDGGIQAFLEAAVSSFLHDDDEMYTVLLKRYHGDRRRLRGSWEDPDREE